MPTANTKNKRMDLAFAALLSDDDEQILTALTRIEEDGDAQAIPPLLRSLRKAKDPKVRNRITSLLFQVKASGADAMLFSALEDPELVDERPIVLATFWNAGLDVRDHLERFVEIAIEGTAAECFECLTVVENQEIWPEKAVRSALAKLKNATAEGTDPYKATLLAAIVSELGARIGRDQD